MQPKDPTPKPRLVDDLRGGRRDLAVTAGLASLASLAGFVVAFWYVEPPPPDEIKIAAGPPGGAYAALAESLADHLRASGVTLSVLSTAGSVENYRLLTEDPSVRLAIVQGGAAPSSIGPGRFESLGALFPEPLWVFHNSELQIESLADLAGHRVAVGQPGSGCRLLAKQLLAANGVHADQSGARLVEIGTVEAAAQLRDGLVDAAFFVVSPAAPMIAELVADERLTLLTMTRGAAYAQRYPALHEVVLPRGIIDLQRDLPADDVALVAPLANLVATPELHDAFIPLLLEGAENALGSVGRLVSGVDSPSLEGVEFPTNAVARHYFENGPPLLQRHLGFWLASLIDRAKIMIVPLVVLLIPAAKVWPPVYRWRIRSRIYRWYGLLRDIDQQLRLNSDQDLAALQDRLRAIESELEQVSVPLSYMEEFYHLRLHIDLVLRGIEDRRERDTGAQAT